MRRWEADRLGSIVWGIAFTGATLVVGLVVSGAALHDVTTLAQKHFQMDFLRRALVYGKAKYYLWVAGQVVKILTLGFLAAYAGARFGHEVQFRAVGGAVTHGYSAADAAKAALVLVVVLELASLPLGYLRGFWLEHQFGLSTQSFSLWVEDRLKWFVLTAAVAVPALVLLRVGMARFPSRWWLPAGAVFGSFLVVVTLVSPLIIDPLFHRFKPLEDRQLESAIVDMAERAGIRVKGVLVMDASTRTTRANAYFTGIGPTKRIVLYDNLLRDLERDEAEVVVAHEIAHWKYGHIIKGIALAAAGGFAFFALFCWMGGGGATSFAGAQAHPLSVFCRLLLLAALLGLMVMPVENWVSRRFEMAADKMAIELSGNPDAHIRLEKKLSISNLSDVDPHPFVKAVLFTHPPVIERIALGEKARASAPTEKSRHSK